MVEDSAVEHKINQEVGMDDESTGEKVTSNENKSEKVSKAEAKPPASPAINDLTTGDFILDKVGSYECRAVVLSLTTVLEKQVISLLAPLFWKGICDCEQSHLQGWVVWPRQILSVG